MMASKLLLIGSTDEYLILDAFEPTKGLHNGELYQVFRAQLLQLNKEACQVTAVRDEAKVE